MESVRRRLLAGVESDPNDVPEDRDDDDEEEEPEEDDEPEEDEEEGEEDRMTVPPATTDPRVTSATGMVVRCET